MTGPRLRGIRILSLKRLVIEWRKPRIEGKQQRLRCAPSRHVADGESQQKKEFGAFCETNSHKKSPAIRPGLDINQNS